MAKLSFLYLQDVLNIVESDRYSPERYLTWTCNALSVEVPSSASGQFLLAESGLTLGPYPEQPGGTSCE